jgi:hypothetical protein
VGRRVRGLAGRQAGGLGILAKVLDKAFVSAGLAGSGSKDLGGLYILEDQWVGESGDLLFGRLVV